MPEIDGRTLHELILKHRYQRAVEIGTSTGHSGVWIAWALSKTGGKLVTIDIDARRHAIAVANFREAGLADYIDARLGNAHEIVPRLEGPMDFVFSDADKEWVRAVSGGAMAEAPAGRLFHRAQCLEPRDERDRRVPGPGSRASRRRDDDRHKEFGGDFNYVQGDIGTWDIAA